MLRQSLSSESPAPPSRIMRLARWISSGVTRIKNALGFGRAQAADGLELPLFELPQRPEEPQRYSAFSRVIMSLSNEPLPAALRPTNQNVDHLYDQPSRPTWMNVAATVYSLIPLSLLLGFIYEEKRLAFSSVGISLFVGEKIREGVMQQDESFRLNSLYRDLEKTYARGVRSEKLSCCATLSDRQYTTVSQMARAEIIPGSEIGMFWPGVEEDPEITLQDRKKILWYLAAQYLSQQDVREAKHRYFKWMNKYLFPFSDTQQPELDRMIARHDIYGVFSPRAEVLVDRVSHSQEPLSRFEWDTLRIVLCRSLWERMQDMVQNAEGTASVVHEAEEVLEDAELGLPQARR